MTPFSSRRELALWVALLYLVVSQQFFSSKVSDGEQLSKLSAAPQAAAWDPKIHTLAIPPGEAQNLPSITVEDAQLDKKRRSYGGAGDKPHLGGFAEMDPGGISVPLWKHMMTDLGVRSFLDVGCGRGFSTSWFYTHGADVLCAEGSHDAVKRSILPPERVVEHDFSRGPWVSYYLVTLLHGPIFSHTSKILTPSFEVARENL
jgi:hypothetical protein